MGRSLGALSLALVFVASLAGPAGASTPNTWRALGPSAAQVLALVASPAAPNVLYAATQDRVWKSTNGGQSWTATSSGPTAVAQSMVARPEDADDVVVAGRDCSVWVSSDGGSSWSHPSTRFNGVAACTLLLAWSPSGLFALARGKVYSSSDGGLTWSLVGTPPDGDAGRALVVLPTTPATIYIGTELGTVRRSTDGGVTWANRSAGLPTSTEENPFPDVYRLAVDPADGSILYAEVASVGVFRTTDGGGSWEAVPPPAAATVPLSNPVTLATTPTTLIAAGGATLFRSQDGGASWTPATVPPGGLGSGFVTGFLADPSNANALYMSAFGVYRSLDAGDTFEYSGNGLDKASVHTIVPVTGSPGSYLVATEGVGVQRTDDDGESWQVTNDGVIGQTLQLAAHPSDGDVFFLEAGGHLWKTTNGGGHWNTSDAGYPYGTSAVAIDPSSPSNVYAGHQNGSVYRSTDGGATWSGSTLPAPGGAVRRLAVDPTNGNRVYAGTNAAFYRSSDAGASWTRLHTDYVYDVFVAHDGDVFLSVYWAVLRFGPSSSTPALTSTLPDFVYAFAENPVDAETLYAGTTHGVYQSVDGGARWAKLTTAGLDSEFITDVTSVTAGHLMVGTPRGTATIDLAPLTATAAQVDEITTTSVRFTGSGNPGGASATAFFEYGPTASYGSTTASTTLGSGNDPVSLIANVTGLSPGTTYHYRLVVQSGGGIAVTDDATFTTAVPAPTASTGNSTLLSSTRARLAGSVNPNGGATSYWFEYGTTTGYGQQTTPTSAGSGSAATAVQAELTGLSPATTYHYRLVAQNSGGTSFGVDRQFTMPDPVPLASTTHASFVTFSEALLLGDVNPNGEPTSYWFEYGTTDSYGTQTPSVSAGSGLIQVTVGAQLTGLLADTTYHFRIVAQSAGGTSFGADRQFTTHSTPPTASTGAASSVTWSGALLAGTVNPNGKPTSYWFEYGTEPFYGTQTPSTSAGSGAEAVAVEGELTELQPATTYYYRVVAQNVGGTSYGARREFTTASTPLPAPTASTGSAFPTSGGVALTGSVNPRGAATSYWFEYGTTNSYGTQTPSTSAGSGSAEVAVEAELTDLLPATTYHYRLVAQNAGGTSFGADREVTTASIPANVPPVMETVSRPTLRPGRLVGGAIPLALSWSATPGSAAICSYEVYKGSDAAPPTGIAVVETNALSTSSQRATGVYYRVRALGCDGTVSEFADSAPVDLRLLQEATPALRRSAGWTRLAATDASGGYVLRTTAHDARVTLSFTGRSLAFVAPKGAPYGAVSVIVDGGAATRIDLHRASRAPQVAVYVVNFPSSGEHKVVIRARAVGSRRRVDVDAFAVIG